MIDRPIARRVQTRPMRAARLDVARYLTPQVIEINGIPRTYSVAPGPHPYAPLLLVLHGAGGTGTGMAALTDFHRRGPAAGYAMAFPDGWRNVWNDSRNAPRLAHREGIDDVAFLNALVARLVTERVTVPGPIFAAGMSNGALLAEHLARHQLLDLAGIALVAGGATVVSRQIRPTPSRPTAVLIFHGTADPIVTYSGGPIAAFGRLMQRRAARDPSLAGRGVSAAIEQVANDWVTANRGPANAQLTPLPCDLPVTRLHWQAAGGAPTTLYRIDGGGHTWPGGAQYLPRSIIGPVSRNLDATAIILDAFTAVHQS
jgi:polyhydroxybutyrate depolymerase